MWCARMQQQTPSRYAPMQPNLCARFCILPIGHHCRTCVRCPAGQAAEPGQGAARPEPRVQRRLRCHAEGQPADTLSLPCFSTATRSYACKRHMTPHALNLSILRADARVGGRPGPVQGHGGAARHRGAVQRGALRDARPDGAAAGAPRRWGAADWALAPCRHHACELYGQLQFINQAAE